MIDVVYATTDATVPLEGGGIKVVPKGTHWDANDPIVASHRELFSVDPRYGLQASPGHTPAGWDDPPIEQAPARAGRRS